MSVAPEYPAPGSAAAASIGLARKLGPALEERLLVESRAALVTAA